MMTVNRELGGLLTLNIELTNRCNKSCWMCGRRKLDKDSTLPQLNYGDMDISLVKKISEQLPDGIVVQFHNNGEPLLYPDLRYALGLFNGQIKCLDTNGKLLMDRFDDVVDNLDTLTVSTFENDTEAEEQYKSLTEFLRNKGDRKPNVIIRCLGEISSEFKERYKSLGCTIASRVLHSSMGSFNYTKKTTVPEIGICLEMISHPAVNKDGDLSICVRFDPYRKGVLGNLNNDTLLDIWNSPLRKKWLGEHIRGCRGSVPLCSKCDFWGIPRGD